MDGESNMTDGEQRGLEQYFYKLSFIRNYRLKLKEGYNTSS